MILIFTNKQDVHSDEVIRHLYERGVKVFRINSEDLLHRYQVNLSINDSGVWDGMINDELGRVLDLSKVEVAWFRKPEFSFSPRTPDFSVGEFIISETKAVINTLYSMPNITWVNDPFIANGSKVKFQQLCLVKKYGIRVPKTLITTKPNMAKKFFEECAGTVLIKAIYTGNIAIDGINQGIPSRKIEGDSFYEFCDTVSLAPTQFQEYIEKDFELRITVIGNQVFAVKIDSQANEETKVDWRLHTEMNPHSIFQLPRRIEDFCLGFLEEQGLIYGAMDFIVTPEGDYVFLENNPFGQYLWLETETGIPLTEAMCDLLTSYAAD